VSAHPDPDVRPAGVSDDRWHLRAHLPASSRGINGAVGAVCADVFTWFGAQPIVLLTADGCCVPGSGGWVKGRAERGRVSDAVDALEAVAGTRMIGGSGVSG
jgi:hypothetical protein